MDNKDHLSGNFEYGSILTYDYTLQNNHASAKWKYDDIDEYIVITGNFEHYIQLKASELCARDSFSSGVN